MMSPLLSTLTAVFLSNIVRQLAAGRAEYLGHVCGTQSGLVQRRACFFAAETLGLGSRLLLAFLSGWHPSLVSL